MWSYQYNCSLQGVYIDFSSDIIYEYSLSPWVKTPVASVITGMTIIYCATFSLNIFVRNFIFENFSSLFFVLLSYLMVLYVYQ
jgi:hypothetical protein